MSTDDEALDHVPDPAPDEAVTEQPGEQLLDEQLADDLADEPEPIALDPAELTAAVEAVLFVVDAPVTVAVLAAALRRPSAEVQQALDRLRADYTERGAGIVRQFASAMPGPPVIRSRAGPTSPLASFVSSGPRYP